jgi:hypothetical protein
MVTSITLLTYGHKHFTAELGVSGFVVNARYWIPAPVLHAPCAKSLSLFSFKILYQPVFVRLFCSLQWTGFTSLLPFKICYGNWLYFWDVFVSVTCLYILALYL